MSLTDEERANATDVQATSDGVYYLPSDGTHFDVALSEEEKLFRAFVDEMHDSDTEARVSVGKKHVDDRGRPIGRKVFQCFECGIDDYTFAQLCMRIRDEFGTGLYRIVGRKADGTFAFQRTIGVQAPMSADEDDKGGSDIAALIDKFSFAMERQQDRTEHLIAALDSRRGGGMFDNMTVEKATALLTAGAGFLAALGFKPFERDEKKTVIEQLTEAKLAKELLSEFGSSDGGDANIFSLLSKTVENIGPLIGAAVAQGTESGAIDADGVVRSQPQALPSPAATPEQNIMSEEQKALVEAHQQNVAFLLMQAKASADPKAVTDLIISAATDEQLEGLDAFLQRDDFLQVMAAANPEVPAYSDWFNEWRRVTVSALDDVFFDDDEPTAEDGEQKDLTSEGEGAETTKESAAGDQDSANDADVSTGTD